MTTPRNTLLRRLLDSKSVAELQTLRVEIAADVAAAKVTLRDLENEFREVEAAIAARTGQQPLPFNGARRRARRNGRPTLRQAILSVMAERNEPWTRNEVFQAVVDKGFGPAGSNPRNTFGNRFTELVQEGQIVPMDDGDRFILLKPATKEEVPPM